MTNTEPNDGNEASELPFIDEHSRRIPVAAEGVWDALVTRVAGFDNPLAGRYAWLVGARPDHAAGRFPQLGATLPGFEVTGVEPPRKLVLAGRHVFSRYSLTFLLEPEDGQTLVRAVTHSQFPGLHGRLYRAAVIGSRGHRVSLRRLLASVETAARTGSG